MALLCLIPLIPTDAAAPGKRFYAIQNLDNTSMPTLRGRAFDSGLAHSRVLLRPNTNYREWILDPANLKVAVMSFHTGTVGSRTKLGRFTMMRDSSPDTDGDGLTDLAEFIVNTRPDNPDTDGDGLLDGAEILQGTDPLVNPDPNAVNGGLIAQTGIIAAAPTGGTAADIAAANNTVVTANGSAGVTVFNVTGGRTPTRLAEIDTPGIAVAVACGSGFAAVADFNGGVIFIDLPARGTPAIRQQVVTGAPVVAIAATGPLVVAGTTTSEVLLIDGYSGVIMDRDVLAGGGAIEDLAFWREAVYALRVGKLTALQMGGSSLTTSATLNLSGERGLRRWRLSAAEGTLYATHKKGVNIVDVNTAPLSPSLVQFNTTTRWGWKQLVPTGSRRALGAVGTSDSDAPPHDVDLFDMGASDRTLGDPTPFETPGNAYALTLYNGFAFVADGASGLQVVNTLGYDSFKQPPSIGLASSSTLDHANRTGDLESGKLARFSALVNDDVQVRNVEFWINGSLAATDGNYPFEYRFIAPLLTASIANLKIKAKATDTGGNVAWTGEYTLTLRPEMDRPTLVSLWPAANSRHTAISSTYATFSEPMKQESLVSGFTVSSAGPDGMFGTADDILIPGTVSLRNPVPVAFLTFSSQLAPGSYRIRIGSPATDLAGNLIIPASGSTYAADRTFEVFSTTDIDHDGVPDEWEVLLGMDPNDPDSNHNGTSDGDEDTDGDGVPNRWEIAIGTDPMMQRSDGVTLDGQRDQDGDGFVDWKEAQAGTSLFAADTDGDGFDDGTEIASGMNPLVFNRSPIMTASSGIASFINVGYVPIPLVQVPISTAPVSFYNAALQPLPEIQIPVKSAPVSFQNNTP